MPEHKHVLLRHLRGTWWLLPKRVWFYCKHQLIALNNCYFRKSNILNDSWNHLFAIPLPRKYFLLLKIADRLAGHIFSTFRQQSLAGIHIARNSLTRRRPISIWNINIFAFHRWRTVNTFISHYYIAIPVSSVSIDQQQQQRLAAPVKQ